MFPSCCLDARTPARTAIWAMGQRPRRDGLENDQQAEADPRHGGRGRGVQLYEHVSGTCSLLSQSSGKQDLAPARADVCTYVHTHVPALIDTPFPGVTHGLNLGRGDVQREMDVDVGPRERRADLGGLQRRVLRRHMWPAHLGVIRRVCADPGPCQAAAGRASLCPSESACGRR